MAREMKDSGIPWIGEIPSDWDISTLGKFISIDSGISVGKKYEPQTPLVEVPYLRVANVQGDHLDLSDVATIWVTPEEAEKYRLKPGQLLMTEGGDRDKLGRGRLWNGEIEGCIHQNHVFAVQTDNRLLVRYLDYLTTSEVARAYFDVTAKKTTNLACTSKSMIQRFAIPIPKVSEQEAIVAYLDMRCLEIDAVLAKIRTSIEEYKKLRQAIITQTVAKGIRRDRPMKESGIEWADTIPKEIKISRLGLHYDIILGKMLCSAQVDDTYTLEPYYCAADVHFEGISDGERKKMWYSPSEKELYLVIKHDLLVVEGGAGAGGCAIVVDEETPTYIQNSIMIVRTKHSGDCRYVRYWLECLVRQGYIDVVCNKATIPHFTKDKLASVPYFVFSEQERSEIADYLDEQCAQINAIIQKKEQFRSELEAYKKSLIYEYVTGKKEVHKKCALLIS